MARRRPQGPTPLRPDIPSSLPPPPLSSPFSLLTGKKFIEGIDANDNGISAYPQDISPKFEPAISITGMVAGLNPSWNEDPTDDERDARFDKASVLMGEQFLQKLDYYGKSWLPARDIVIRALEDSKDLDKQGRILHLPQFCPWKVPNPLSSLSATMRWVC